MENIRVKKRNGSLEPVQLDKIHRVLHWAAEGLNVSVSEVELKSHIQFFDGITTKEIHEIMIKSAADLISPHQPDYQYFAARLLIYHLRKIAYRDYTPPPLYDHVKKMVEMGRYDAHLLEDYTKEEFEEIDELIDHDRDNNFTYAAVKQLEGKYLVKDRVTGQIFETPQFIYALVPMCLFASYPKETRMDYIKRFYEAASTFKISLPTPIMAGVRTPTRQFSSCVLVDCDDSLDSINATSSAIVKYVSQRAGIGVNVGRIRALGSPIRGGEAFHTGMVPFIKHFQTAVKSCSQGGVRGGAATAFYPLWHLEIESLLVLKNNRGVEENRARHLDYGVQINKTLYKRFLNNQDITLFSPSDVPGLYEAFFSDENEFERLYTKYEQDPNIRKMQVPAMELFSTLAMERAQTGRIYIMNVDHANTHSAFDEHKAPIYQSNLCMEITLPTKPLQKCDDPEGEIALCTLSALNLGKIENDEEMKECCNLIVRALDNLLDYQNYPFEAARKSSQERRTLGVGVTGFAHFLAKNGARYSDNSAINLTHDIFESLQYYLIKASVELAKEKGPCKRFDETKYSKGILPIDTYKRDLDKVCTTQLKKDWDSLREEIKKYGMRNSTLTAQMPCETSSQISNSTNGIEPPRGILSVKASKDGTLKMLAPDFDKYHYELLWDMPSNIGYLNLVGVMQKFMDQAISTNTNYDPSRFPDNKVPVKQILKDILYAYKLGIKTLYYHNTRDGANDRQEDDGCAGGACKL